MEIDDHDFENDDFGRDGTDDEEDMFEGQDDDYVDAGDFPCETFTFGEELWKVLRAVDGNDVPDELRESCTWKDINDLLDYSHEDVCVMFPLGAIGFAYDNDLAGYPHSDEDDYPQDIIIESSILGMMRRLQTICIDHNEMEQAGMIEKFIDILDRCVTRMSNLDAFV